MSSVAIYSKNGKFSKTYVKLEHIPRIGERVSLFYNPAPTVLEVLHMPDEDRIVVMVD